MLALGPSEDALSAGVKRPRSAMSSSAPQQEAVFPVTTGRPSSYARGAKADLRGVSDKKYHREARETERQLAKAAATAAAAEILLPSRAGAIEVEGPMERTWRVSQSAIRDAVDVGIARKGAELALEGGPYAVSWTRSGRHVLLGGARGHVAVVDWTRSAPLVEFNARETVHDVTFLHDHTFFAVAQKRAVHVYDTATGAEAHVSTRTTPSTANEHDMRTHLIDSHIHIHIRPSLPPPPRSCAVTLNHVRLLSYRTIFSSRASGLLVG